MKKKLLLFITLSLLAILMVGRPVSAEANTYTTNEIFEHSNTVYIACANNGNGELVDFNYYLHHLTHMTYDGNDRFHFVHNANIIQGKGEGQITGEAYIASGKGSVTINGEGVLGSVYQYQFVLLTNYIGQGNTGHLTQKLLVRFTISPNGVVTSYVSHESYECR